MGGYCVQLGSPLASVLAGWAPGPVPSLPPTSEAALKHLSPLPYRGGNGGAQQVRVLLRSGERRNPGQGPERQDIPELNVLAWGGAGGETGHSLVR